jgi:hypothetical protein
LTRAAVVTPKTGLHATGKEGGINLNRRDGCAGHHHVTLPMPGRATGRRLAVLPHPYLARLLRALQTP